MKKNFEKKYFETKILKTNICNTTNQCSTICALPRQEQEEKQGVIRAITSYRVMKKSAHAHSALIQNVQFRARIARKECGHFNEVGRNSIQLCYKGGKYAISTHFEKKIIKKILKKTL